MDKKGSNKRNDQKGATSIKDANAGSGAFNQGVEQDPNYDDGTKVSDEEKSTGHTPSPGKEKKLTPNKNKVQDNTGRNK